MQETCRHKRPIFVWFAFVMYTIREYVTIARRLTQEQTILKYIHLLALKLQSQ